MSDYKETREYPYYHVAVSAKSETPRTDEQAAPYPIAKDEEAPFDWVPAEFSKCLERELAQARAENDTLRGLLGNSAKPCPYCGLAAEDQAKCGRGFPGCSRADDQMLSKHFADGYRAEKANAERDALRAENAKLRAALAIVHFKQAPLQ